jgi:hypothetical protein
VLGVSETREQFQRMLAEHQMASAMVKPYAEAYVREHVNPAWSRANEDISRAASKAKSRGTDVRAIEAGLKTVNGWMPNLPSMIASGLANPNSPISELGDWQRDDLSQLQNAIHVAIPHQAATLERDLGHVSMALAGERIQRAVAQR